MRKQPGSRSACIQFLAVFWGANVPRQVGRHTEHVCRVEDTPSDLDATDSCFLFVTYARLPAMQEAVATMTRTRLPSCQSIIYHMPFEWGCICQQHHPCTSSSCDCPVGSSGAGACRPDCPAAAGPRRQDRSGRGPQAAASNHHLQGGRGGQADAVPVRTVAAGATRRQVCVTACPMQQHQAR